MPKPSLRSNSFKKKKINTPGSRSVIHYKKKKVAFAKCGKCGSILHGVPRKRINEIKKLPKSKKRPNRPYAGNLCSACMREQIRGNI